MKKVVIQKVDMDTALTAFLLGVSEADVIVAVPDRANSEDLADPNVLCVECGGSGDVRFGNFDHHDGMLVIPPAFVQANNLRGSGDPNLRALVDYVNLIDTQGMEALKQRSRLRHGAFPTLSDIFSGMLVLTGSAREQLIQGMAICREVVDEGLDPFGVMPDRDRWRKYAEAKLQQDGAIGPAIAAARFFKTCSGLKGGYVETDLIGVFGALYGLGCQLAIAHSPNFQPVASPTPMRKYTIAGNGVRVDSLLLRLGKSESGWGGPLHGAIIGSPRGQGSRLEPEKVIAIVRENL